jgi:hypothetical protein
MRYGADYCSTRCRMAAHRHRHRTPPKPRATPLQDRVLRCLGEYPGGLTVYDIVQLQEPDRCDEDGRPRLTRVESTRRAIYTLAERGLVELAPAAGYSSPCRWQPPGNWGGYGVSIYHRLA